MSSKKTVLVTGSAGLIGSECVLFFAAKGFKVIGVDNNMRKKLFGDEASIQWNKNFLLEKVPEYVHYDIDIRDQKKIQELFNQYKFDLIIHAAAQPSHDWAVKDPNLDFTINANGTLILLENFRKYAPEAVFIFISTNKVYGDRPNKLPFIELPMRYELPFDHQYYSGIDEALSIDNCLHSLFGASKVAADILVQEYGKYFDLKTAVFRGGCLTGPAHSGAELHGFLSYLVRCCITEKKYTIYGYKGKQVRDNIHSYDLVNALYNFYLKPNYGEVYNIGGSRLSNISVLEAIELCEKVSGKKLIYEYTDKSRKGDHIWWISDVSKFKSHYPEWEITYNIEKIIEEIFTQQQKIQYTYGT
ncbi:MAG: NAD-dependent epimerase/dehydratase family protein [Candidatus Omnitrophica bacterium]|nr:NAD-dependent epimerase/dehydratase family protein [Candidatus Omnitrophota bacterium]